MDNTQLILETEKSELLKFFGVEIKEVGAERVVLTMEVTPKVHQYVGIMHGGVSVLLSETAASISTTCRCRCKAEADIRVKSDDFPN